MHIFDQPTTTLHATTFLHDLRHPPISHHRVCSAVNVHNFTPVKRDGYD